MSFISKFFLGFSIGIYALLASASFRLSAQDRRLDDMIRTENEFARISKESGTRKAFLTFMTDSTVMFESGKPYKGRQLWLERPEGKECLFWWPVFAGISIDGNMGYSAGPWELALTRQDRPTLFGYYATVWRKEKDGSWKMAIDAGVDLPGQEVPKREVRLYSNRNQGRIVNDKELASLAESIRKYDADVVRHDSAGIIEYYSIDALILRDGFFPLGRAGFVNDFIALGCSHRTEGFNGAASGDVAYSYGTGKAFYDSTLSDIFFMKVWLRENGKWKIILDLVGKRSES